MSVRSWIGKPGAGDLEDVAFRYGGVVPDAAGAVEGGGDDTHPVRREGGARNRTFVSQDGDFFARRGVPQPRALGGGGDDARPVQREGGAPDQIVVAAQDGDFLARR